MHFQGSTVPVKDIFKKVLAEDTKVRMMDIIEQRQLYFRELPLQTEIETMSAEIVEIKKRNEEISEDMKKFKDDISKQLSENVSKQLDLIMDALKVTQK